jgi:transposase
MRTILEILRLRLDTGLSERKTARSVDVPCMTVQGYHARFHVSGLAWALAPNVDEAALEHVLFTYEVPLPVAGRLLPDWATIAREKKRKGVTLHLLCQEYRSIERDGCGHSQFVVLSRRWRATLDPVLRQKYCAGARAFVDDAS